MPEYKNGIILLRRTENSAINENLIHKSLLFITVIVLLHKQRSLVQIRRFFIHFRYILLNRDYYSTLLYFNEKPWQQSDEILYVYIMFQSHSAIIK